MKWYLPKPMERYIAAYQPISSPLDDAQLRFDVLQKVPGPTTAIYEILQRGPRTDAEEELCNQYLLAKRQEMKSMHHELRVERFGQRVVCPKSNHQN